MSRILTAAALAAILCVPAAWTQDNAGESSGTDLADGTPAQNASPGSVRQRAPGTWINAARARHSELIEQRVNGPRFGQFVEDDLQADSGSTGTTGAPSSLGDLIGQLTGSGALGSLANLLGGSSLGSGFASSGGAIGSGTSGGSTGGIPDNIPPEVIAMIESAGIDLSEVFAKGRDNDTSGTVAQLPDKDVDSRAQSQDSRKFHVRLADSLLSTFFTAVAIGLQSSDFIDALTGFLRPIFFATETDDTAGDATGDSSGDTSTGDGSDGGTTDTDDTGGSTGDGDTGGGGIEDIPPGDSGSDQTDSII